MFHCPSSTDTITILKATSAGNISDEQFFLNISDTVTSTNNVRYRDGQIEKKAKPNGTPDITEPTTLFNSLDSKKHLLLVSDDVKTSKAIEFYFIKMGLENQERCIYLTHGEVENVENDMIDHGINVKRFNKKNLLQVYQVQNPIEDSTSILDGANNILNQILQNPQSRFRIVGRIMPDVGMEEAISIQLYFERMFHSKFETFNGSVMCTYDFSQIQENDRWHYWLDSLEKYHHIVISCRNGKTTVKSSC